MAIQNIKAQSANRIELVFDNQVFGMCQSLTCQDDYSPVAVSGIGDIHAVEYSPTMARHTLNCENVILLVNNLRQMGITALNGDDMLRGMVFDIVVTQKDTGALVRKYSGCSYASGDVRIEKHTILMSNASFNALDVSGTGA